MNATQPQEQNPQWSQQWNHMALPTFGFIFAVPEPPSGLRLPAQHKPLAVASPHQGDVSSGQKSDIEDAPPASEPSQQSLAISKLQSRRQRKSESDKRSKQRSQPLTKPVSALQRGNTDPFSAAGITITPQINQVLTFARDVCLPAFYLIDSLRDSSISAEFNRDVANSSGWISSPAARLGWQQVVDALSDKCTALACLSTYLALMSACDINPAKATEASLKMRAGSSALLRQRLLRHDSQNADVDTQRELLWQVFWHFYAEFCAGNMIAAQIHGKMLRQSCETAEEGVITDHFLDSVIFVDAHMSAKFMTHPVLDIETWVPNVFASTWEKIDTQIAQITGETGERLHPTVAPEYLRTIFIRTRQALILLQQAQEARSYDIDFETLYYWLNSHSYVDNGTLINTYLTLVEEGMTPPSLPRSDSDPSHATTDSLGTIHTRAALCLAALFAIRDIGQEVRINGIDIVDASSTIAKHLKEALEQARTHCTPEESRKYHALHLWCAFIGALSEQRRALPVGTDPPPPPPPPPPPRPRSRDPKNKKASSSASTTPPEIERRRSIQVKNLDASSMRFNHLFAEIARNMGLLSWQQVSDALKQFIYTDLSEPHGSRWFWKTMGAYLDRKRKAAREEQERRRAEARESGNAGAGAIGRSTSASRGAAFQGQTPQGQTGEQRRWSTVDTSRGSEMTHTGQRQGDVAEGNQRWGLQKSISHENAGKQERSRRGDGRYG